MIISRKHGYIFWKSKALIAFKNFKVLVEKEVDSLLKVHCIDRGGEYNSLEFANFCESHGLKRQLIATYMPQQNGVVSRRHNSKHGAKSFNEE